MWIDFLVAHSHLAFVRITDSHNIVEDPCPWKIGIVLFNYSYVWSLETNSERESFAFCVLKTGCVLVEWIRIPWVSTASTYFQLHVAVWNKHNSKICLLDSEKAGGVGVFEISISCPFLAAEHAVLMNSAENYWMLDLKLLWNQNFS